MHGLATVAGPVNQGGTAELIPSLRRSGLFCCLAEGIPRQRVCEGVVAMALPKRYDANEAEVRIGAFWHETAVYTFDREDVSAPVYSIDTPPPTVSGHLHLGHVYSYSHTDFVARYHRMRGDNVFYPMGFDDNGLPTERLVEHWEGVRAEAIGREAFIERCLAVSERAEADYRALWQRLGLSIDWNHTYRTIGPSARRVSQISFLDLVHKGLAYRQEAPTIWCPTCHTAIAQADLADFDRASVFYTLAFELDGGEVLKVATTRPELLPACVAVFVHPDDTRYTALAGRTIRVPYCGQTVPIIPDPGADPQKGTGAVMCCTFGDVTDVAWWRAHDLPLRIAIDRKGRMTQLAGPLMGLGVVEARAAIVEALDGQGALLGRQEIQQTVRVHDRCDTPAEYAVSQQWFVRVLDRKAALLDAGSRVQWHPPYMAERYREWVDGLSWDWCISRQRVYGVAFPVWYCADCGAVILAEAAQLPVDPTETGPGRACICGSTRFVPETDVMDTWATSSVSPQIVGQWLDDPELYARVMPFTVRPQAHEIIRTWAFYTILKSLYSFGVVPWSHAAISGWGLAPEGTGKISKSRGGGPMPPLAMIEAYSADAVRYWAGSTGPGRDAVISEDKIQAGAKLVTKLWNVARFAERFIGAMDAEIGSVARTPADRWLLARLARVVRAATREFENYDYAAAKSEVEGFFWRDLADNYLEMAKLRLYGSDGEEAAGARMVVMVALETVIKLLAPFLPYVTEEIYQHLYAEVAWKQSIHRTLWPVVDARHEDAEAEAVGEKLVAIASAVRRYKSEQAMSLGAELGTLVLRCVDKALTAQLVAATPDLRSVTRAQDVVVSDELGAAAEILETDTLAVGVV